MATITVESEDLKKLIESAVESRVTPLVADIHQLATTINAKVATPSQMLTVVKAGERVSKHPKTIRSWIKMGLLTERRSGRGSRAHHLILVDELDVLISDGPEAARRYRSRMGRA